MKTFEENKKSTRKKMSIICHQPFHILVRLFPGLFWGQPIDSAGEGSGSFCK
jgi:hypothetical protein